MIRTKYPQANILNHLKMIKKIAYSFHVSTGIEFEDLYQQACLIWLDTISTWNPAKSKVTTYMWNVLVNSLTSYIQKIDKYRKPLNEYDSAKMDEAVYQSYYFEKLSMEALAIVDLVTFNPSDFLFISKPQAINKIENKMSKSGWNASQIRYGIKQLEKSF